MRIVSECEEAENPGPCHASPDQAFQPGELQGEALEKGLKYWEKFMKVSNTALLRIKALS